MATAQKVRSQSKQGQWSSIFPNEQVTETQSTLFVKKLLAVAVSSISYLRALFPENAFGDRCLEDVNLKILRDDSSCPEACRVIQWIRGCFAALEKKYLRSVLVGIYEDPDDPDTVIEEYSFKFSYGDGAGVDIYRNGAKITTSKSDSETKKATIRLLRTIVLLSQTLNPLPDDVMMTMKLNYYDDVTPEDYNPPGFKDCEHDTFTFKEEPMNIKVGDVSTQYHSIKLRIKTSNHDLQDAAEEQEMQDEELPIQNKVVDDEKPSTTSDETPAKKSTTMDEKSPTVDDDERPPIAQQSSEPPTPLSAVASKANTRTTTPASSVLQDDEEVVTKCPCGVDEDDGLMILCASCNTWQHATCFAILDPEKAPDTHYCVLCSKKNHQIECTDAILGNIEELTEIKANCLWRRTLVAVLETTRILAPNLSKRLGVAVVVATSLLKRLENEGFVTNGGKAKRFGKLVKKEVITGRGFNKYFKYIESELSEDVEMMTERASGMDIRSKKEPHENETTSGSGKKRKSVMSSKNKELRFEITDSQASQSPTSAAEMSAKKRRKGSISAEPMCV